MDFVTKEVVTWKGLVRYHILLVMDLATRRVEIAGIIPEPHGAWMTQIARNLTFEEEGFLADKSMLIMDRAPVFDAKFVATLENGGVEVKKLPPRSPNLNAYLERFNRSLKEECLDQVIIFGRRHLEHLCREFLIHYHRERPHQGLENQMIDPMTQQRDGPIQCRERLGGLLKYYHRDAA